MDSQECVVCLEPYSDILKPILLDCGHGICLQCLNNFLLQVKSSPQDDTKKQCPKCRKVVFT